MNLNKRRKNYENSKIYVSDNDPSEYITCYIRNMLTDETIIFKTLPDSVSETFSTSWSTHEVLGRSAPYFNYSGNDARSVSYSIKLFKDALGGEFTKVVRQIESLAYPQYNGVVAMPPYCYVRFGAMIKMFAVVNSVSVNWGDVFIVNRDEYNDANENSFSSADISIDFSELIQDSSRIPVGWSDGSGINLIDRDF